VNLLPDPNQSITRMLVGTNAKTQEPLTQVYLPFSIIHYQFSIADDRSVDARKS